MLLLPHSRPHVGAVVEIMAVLTEMQEQQRLAWLRQDSTWMSATYWIAKNHLRPIHRAMVASDVGTYYKFDAERFAMTQLRIKLWDMGFRYCGSGAYSIALDHVDYPGEVLKLTFGDCLDEQPDMPTSGGATWVNYCLEHQGEHMIPEISQAGVINQVPFVWMKRYEKGREDGRVYICENWRDHDWKDPDLVRIQELMAVAENELGGCEDLHSENLMWDRDLESWVLTDPIC